MANVVKKVGIFEPPAKPKITKEMKANMAQSGLEPAEQKAALAEQLAAAKAQYVEDVVAWKAKPETDAQTVEALKSDLAEYKASMPEKKAQIASVYAEEVAAANAMEPFERKVALMKAKEKRHNALLDLKESLRIKKEAFEKATCSPAQVYKRKQASKTRAAIWRDRNLYLMLVPFIAWYVVFHYMPMYGLTMAFRVKTPFRPQEAPFLWEVGKDPFYHFKAFLELRDFPRLLRNTLVINLLSLVLSFPMPIIFALLLNELRQKMFKTTVQTISYLPYFISSVVVASLVTNILAPSGLLNRVITTFSGNPSSTPFLEKANLFPWIYVLMTMWKGTGFDSIIFTSALSGVDQELYEAAHIDGAGRWKQTLHITLPSILPTIAIMLIMRLGSLLNLGYESIVLLYKPATYETADVISSYVYRMGIGGEGENKVQGSTNHNLTTALGLFNAVISLVLVSISNWASKKLGDVGLW